MKRKLIFLVVFVVLLVASGLLVNGLRNRAPKQGELRVDSQPTVNVFLDNKNVGRSPYKDKVNVGEYTIKLVPEAATNELSSWEGKIMVGPNLLTYVNASLASSELSSAIDLLWLEKITSKQSELSVTTNPDGATVLIDNQTKGTTPLSIQDVTIGDHTVTVTSPGFLSRNLKIKTTAGYRVIASFKLALSAGGDKQQEASASPTPVVSGQPTPRVTPTKSATSSATIPGNPEKPYVLIKDTPTGFLRVREEPSTKATESGRVKPGEKYSILESDNGWYEIRYDGTNTGWVSGQYVSKVE